MNAPLTDQQCELLSAWIDGEITDAERATVETLLKNPEAAQYVETMRATAALVATHAKVRAPVGLSGRVLNALEEEFTPKAFSPGSEPFTAIPTLSWRAPLYAAAAAILVAVGIMFGPALTSPGTPTDVSRTALDNLPQTRERDPRPETVVEDSRVLDSLTEKELGSPKPEGPAKDFARANRKFGEGETWDASEDASKSPELEKRRNEAALKADEAAAKNAAKNAGEELKHDLGKTARDPATGAPGPAETPAEKPNDARDGMNGEQPDAEESAEEKAEGSAEAEGSDDPHSGKVGRVGGGAGRSAPKGSDQPEPRGDDSGGGSGGSTGGAATKKDKAAEPTSPSRPALAEADDKKSKDEDGKQTEQLRTIDIANAQTIAAQTDVLWVSNLYGSAELTDDQADVESVAVEIDADKLPELMAALRRLAKDQGYGEVAGDADDQDAPPADRARGQGISGYLPADETEDSRAAADPAPIAPPPAEEKQSAKVRVIIRLK